MSSLEVWLIIILVLGVIASNLAVLKYSSKFKMTQFGKPNHKTDAKAKHSEAAQNTSGADKSSKGDEQTRKTGDSLKDQD